MANATIGNHHSDRFWNRERFGAGVELLPGLDHVWDSLDSPSNETCSASCVEGPTEFSECLPFFVVGPVTVIVTNFFELLECGEEHSPSCDFTQGHCLEASVQAGDALLAIELSDHLFVRDLLLLLTLSPAFQEVSGDQDEKAREA